MVHQHGYRCRLLAYLHHWHISCALRVLSNIHHHSLAGLINQHDHGCLLAVGAIGRWHSTILHGRGWLLPSCASRWVVGNEQTLLRALLLLGAMIGWSASASQEQDGLVHSGNQSAHDVGAGCIRVVHRSWFATHCTDVIVVNITTMGVTVVPILQMFVGSGRTDCLMLTTTRTTKTHGWLLWLWETMAIALTTTIVFVVIGECALLLSGGVAAAWGLLAS